MSWKMIEGYRWPYRIDEEANIQKQLENGTWIDLHPYICGARNRAVVKMRTADNRKVEVPVVWLMADAFMGGRRPGYAIIHKNRAKLDCALENLRFIPLREAGRISCGSRRKPVEKVDRTGRVVAVYASAREAAEKNFISHNSISARCLGRVKAPFNLDGFNYRYVR